MDKALSMVGRSLLFGLLFGLFSFARAAEPVSEWISLGTRIHGGFGSFIPVGIRIGNDAMRRLEAKPRDLLVTFYSGPMAPCPCIADGVMLSTGSSPGQGTLLIAADPAPADLLAVVVIKHRTSGVSLRYSVAQRWLPSLLGWNKALDATGRFAAVMQAENLFAVE